jgi:hypothetical protein
MTNPIPVVVVTTQAADEWAAPPDFCLVPENTSNRRILGFLAGIAQRSKEAGIPGPEVCGEIEAAWGDESDFPTLPAAEIHAIGYAVVTLPETPTWEVSKAVVEPDGTFYVRRLDDLGHRSSCIRLEKGAKNV